MTLIKSISGIRGTIGGASDTNFTPVDIVKFTSAWVMFLRRKFKDKELHVVVGRDARISGEMANRLVCGTLQGMGVHVLDIGLTTTPTTEMAVLHHQADGGIIITASHNPVQWNALKLINYKGEFISNKDGQILQQFAQEARFSYAGVDALGSYTSCSNAIQDHIEAILQLDLVDRDAIARADFSVVIDTVNSTGALALPPLLQQLGVNKVTLHNGEINGVFAHNPEPVPENLTEISNILRQSHYDVGFVVDPDVDRLAIVQEDGEMFGEEYTLVAVADYVLQNTPGNTVSNLSSSRALHDISRKYGVDYNAAAVGEVNVVELMKNTHAVIGGEGNGGVIYPELHYGRDALVGIALFLSHMAKSHKTCSELRQCYPDYHISKNKIGTGDNPDMIALLDTLASKYDNCKINRTDGIKLDFDDCWAHIRPSNTEPVVRIYTEARSQAKADRLAEEIMAHIRNILTQNS